MYMLYMLSLVNIYRVGVARPDQLLYEAPGFMETVFNSMRAPDYSMRMLYIYIYPMRPQTTANCEGAESTMRVVLNRSVGV